MIILELILKELWHRKVNACLAVLAIGAAVALFVTFATMGAAAERETTILMRDLGYNLRIIPKETDETELYERGYPSQTIPQEYMARFAGKKNISYRHMRASLKERIEVNGAGVLLVGITSEVDPSESDKTPMPKSYDIAPGCLIAGFHAAQRLGATEGGEVSIGRRTFRVEHCLAESGSEEDVTVYGNLADVQGILNKQGRINEIQALECLCVNPTVDSIDQLRAELLAILPEAKVIKMQDIAEGRKKQRMTTEAHLSFLLNFAIIGCAAWLGVLAMLNVRERASEIGVLRALGYGSASIASLFLGRGVILGIVGALLGFGAGTALCLSVGPAIFQVTAKAIQPIYLLLAATLVAAPLFTAACTLVPAAMAVGQDPAQTLREV